ncbi:Histone-lysine N-methyltransferase SETMAR [Habropoda laboriosa]|uniref:Histone-lysine N-methyltransferase SETMAR n=1 Tax=Habropoda laboriosa TaxID=597456 RepID=A0A0L7QNP8_9HYME|nr:Histone-lysine N-methyltransferase SETMAR [Habropoda laboriosa]
MKIRICKRKKGANKSPRSKLNLHPKKIVFTVWWSTPELIRKILSHPPYSPDLSPTDFHFFRSLDNFLTQKRFSKEEDIENAFRQFSFP